MRVIPKDLEAVGRLLVAQEWERAAIVYAFVARPGSGRRNGTSAISTSEFAALGIVGLTSHHSVERYHDAWATAIKRRKAKAVKPGDPFVRPDMEWPPDPRGIARSAPGTRNYERAEKLEQQAKLDGIGPSKVVDIASNPKALRTAIKADPETRKAAAAALQEVHDQEVDDSLLSMGVDMKTPLDRFPNEAYAEAQRISSGLKGFAGRINKLREWAPEGEWTRCTEEFEKGISLVLKAIQGPIDWKETVS